MGFYFFTFIVTALLSSIFAGLSPGSEWKGFRVVLTYIMTGWLVSRSAYTKKQIHYLFILIILSTIPPLLWGLFEYLYLHTKIDLQLHSVGHVNHSAIYLTIIFGSTIGLGLALWNKFNSISKLLFMPFTGLLYLSLILTRSRAAVGVGFIIFVILITLLSKNKRSIIYSFSILAIATSLLFLFNAEVIQKQIGLQKNPQFFIKSGFGLECSYRGFKIFPIAGYRNG